jgi:hypothetical protein
MQMKTKSDMINLVDMIDLLHPINDINTEVK